MKLETPEKYYNGNVVVIAHDVYLEIYDWSIRFVFVDGVHENLDIGLWARNLREDDEKELVLNIASGMQGGIHFYNSSTGEAMIVLFGIVDEMWFDNILSHEQRHAEDRIMDFYSVNDIESAGLLSGLIAKKMHQWKKMCYEKIWEREKLCKK